MGTFEDQSGYDYRSVEKYLDELGDQRILEITLLYLSGIAFLVSLALPAAPAPFGARAIYGYQMLMFAVIPAWWANPLMIAAWLCGYYRKYLCLILCSLAAIGLALSVFLVVDFPRLGPAYYTWVASIALTLTAGLVKPLDKLRVGTLAFIAKPQFKLLHVFVLLIVISIAFAGLSVKYHQSVQRQLQHERAEAYASVIGMNSPSHNGDPPPYDEPFHETRLNLERGNDHDLKHLRRFTNLDTLTLRSAKFSDEGLKEIRTLRGLKRLTILFPNITPAGLEAISQLPELQELTVERGNQIDDAALRSLSRLKSLKSLSLHHTRATGTGLIHLWSLPNLKKLDISGVDLSDGGISTIGELKQIESLSLAGNKLTSNCLRQLQGLPALKELSLSHYRPYAAPLNYPVQARITDEAFRDLRDLNQLQTLRLTGLEISDASFADISGINSLQCLEIRCDWITGNGIRDFASLVSLRELTLSSLRLDHNYIGDLQSCQNLKSLRFNVRKDVPLSTLGDLKQLEELTIHGYSNDQALAGIAPLTNLKTLSLHGSFSDKGIKHLQHLAQLEELTLATSYRGGGRITDACLIHLRNLKNLKKLRFQNTKVSSEGAKKLKLELSPTLEFSR